MSRISETAFFKQLENKNTDLSKMLCGLLIALEKPTENLLGYVTAVFPSFTDHSFTHTIRILENTSQILSEEFINSLSSVEIFCLFCAAMYHDCGMTIPNMDNVEEQRSKHHLLVKGILEIIFEKHLSNNLPASNRIYNCVLFACESHNMDIEEFYGHIKFNTVDTIDGCQIRYNIIASLLRIGDLLDMAEDRVFENTLNILPYYFYNNNSISHHIRHLKIDNYKLTPKNINIVVNADTKDEYFIWSQWFQYLRNDIEKANTYIFKDGNLHFPPFTYKINHNLQIENLRFELDTEGQLIDIITNSIYTNEYDFIRELIQNAIDSELKQIYLSKDTNIEHSSPRSWKSYTKNNNVLVLYSSKDHRLIVSDCGIGMDSHEIKECLFQLANSGTSSTDRIRNFPFYSIAKFGIGFISCITRANRISVYSKKDDCPMSLVTMYSNSIYAFFEESEEYSKDDNTFNGTTIDLTLKNSYSAESIKEYIFNTFKYTSVAIQYFDIDEICGFSTNHSKTDILDNLLNKKSLTYKEINDCYNQLKVIKNSLISAQNAITQPYENAYSNGIMQYNLLEKSAHRYEYLPQITFIDILENINKPLIPLSESGGIENLEQLIIETKKLNKKNYENEYDRLIDTVYDKLDDLQEYIFEKRRNFTHYPMLSSVIVNDFVAKSNVYLAHIDNELNIDSMHLNELPLIDDESYLLIIQSSIIDYDQGVELTAWNGFIINNHENVNKIERVRFVRNNDDYEYSDTELFDKNISIHSNCDLASELSYYDNIFDNSNFSIEKQIEYVETLEKDSIELTGSDILLSENNKAGLSMSYIESQILGFNYRNEKHEQAPLDFFEDMYHTKSVLYQDGIKLDVDISHLLPFGFCKCVANLTATSRFPLNITRHNISNNLDIINKWLEQTGDSIQDYVLKNIIENLKKINISVNYDEIVSRYTKNTLFGSQCLKSAKINRNNRRGA